MTGRTLRTAPLEVNLEQTLEKLGGEDIIRRKYPELYKAVLNTREGIKTALRGVSNEGGDYIFGSEDSCKIRTLNYSPDTTLSTVSSMEMEKAKPSLAIIGDIIDSDTGKSIDGFAVTVNDSHTLSGESTTLSSELAQGKSKQFIARSSFIVIEKDENGKNIVKTLDSVMDSRKTVDDVTIVKNLNVNAPMPVKHSGAGCTTVYYNRSGSEADYQYTNVKYGNDSIDVYMPFSGSVEFATCVPDPVNPIVWDGANGLILQIENVHNGCANFDMKNKDDIKWNVTGSVLSWEFPDNWHSVLTRNKLTCANNMNFYCKMFINTSLGYPLPIVIQSNGEEHKDPSYKKIPYINILWGCFAKDVLIRMADGKSRPIEQIKKDDKVMTMDGSVRTVKEIVAGEKEEKLVHIKTASENRIQVSLEHPMLTVDGMVKAKDLTAGTILVTEDGKESIESLYLVDYNDKVYNLRLDSKGVLIANSFYAGDFAEQNSGTQTPAVLRSSQRTEEIQQELADFIYGINKTKNNDR